MVGTGIVKAGLGIGLIVGLAAAAAAQGPTFRAASTFSLPGLTTDATSLLMVTDVGSPSPGTPDGIPDVVTAGQSQVAAVLFGCNPDAPGASCDPGDLVTGPNTRLGRIPTALTLGEFNDTAGIDLLIADTGNSVLCFRGFADGPPFERQGDATTVGDNPVAFATYDFNDDDRSDVAVLHQPAQGPGEIWILYADGDCTFSPPPFPRQATVTTGNGSSAIVVGDFNDDGAPDFAVTNASGNDVSIIHGDADGTFDEVQRIDVSTRPGGGSEIVEPVGVRTGLFDGDDRLDLVVVNRNADDVAIMIGRADGTFGTPQSFPSGSSGSSPRAIDVGDVDGDGNLDVVVANNFSSDASVLRGDGTGRFGAPRIFMADQEPLAIAVTELDGDGRPDLVVSNRGNDGPTAAVLLGFTGDALASIENVSTDASPSALAVGDVDNDGFADLIAGHGSGVVRIARARSEGGFEPLDEATIVVGGSVSAVAAADFDGDLLTDLAVAREDDGIVGFLRGRPGARFASEVPISVGTGPSALTTGDWNGDGVDDAAVARQRGDEAGRVEILLGGPDGLAAAGGLLAGLTPVDVAAGDFDADGNMDLVVANNVSADVTILRGGGDGNFSPAGTLSVGGAARAVDVADFDLDGCDDFVVGLSMDGLVVPYFGACNATFARGPQTLSGALSPAGLVAEDFTGDGIADVAMGDEVNNMVIFFTKRANDRFFLNFPGDDYTVSRRPVHMRAGDFDGDGRYEAITLNSFVAGSISVLTSIVGDGGLRGDANDDAVVSAADLAGVLLEVSDGDGNRVVESINAYPGGPGADANGDAVISRQDVRAVAARIFPRS